MMKKYQFLRKNEQKMIKIITSEKRGVHFVFKILCKSINRDAEAIAKVIFVNFVPFTFKMMKIRCIDTVHDPSLLIENEKSMTGKVTSF